MWGIKFFFFLALIVQVAFATTFIPLSLDKQVESATMGAEVVLMNMQGFKHPAGYVATEYRFKVIEPTNFNTDELEDGKLILTLPGGNFDGVTTVVDGSPKFNPGEKIFLLLKKVEGKIYLSNFTLGKFNIQKIDGVEYYVNEVFPNLQNVGRIKKSTMKKLMEEKWNLVSIHLEPKKPNDKNNSVSILKLPIEKQENLKEVKPERTIASEENNIDWLNIFIYCLSVFGIIFSLLLLKSKKNE